MSSNPNSSDFHYKEYSLKQLDNWVNDALNCDDLSPQDIYDTIIQCVDESVEHHKNYLDKSIKLLSLLKGHREIDFEDVMKEREYYEGWDYTATGEKFPRNESKSRTWTLPVEQVHDEYFISFPDDLLEAANIKIGDTLEWIDNKNGSFSLVKSDDV